MKRVDIVKMVLLLLVTICFSANAWGKTVTLSWDASPSTVAGYKIFYDTSSSSPLEGSGADEGGAPIDVGNVLTYTVHGLPDGSDHYFAVSAYDTSGNESTYSNIVHSPPVVAGNNPPVLAAISSKTVLEGATVSFTLSASDADGDSLTYSASNLPVGAGLNSATGLFTWTPAMNQSGSYSITFSVSDGNASDAKTATITVTDVAVNNPPVLSNIGSKSVAENSSLTFTISGSDPDNDALSYRAEGLPSGASFNPVTREFSWIPGYGETTNTRVYPVTFIVSDGVAEDSELVTINVTNVNRPPVLEAIGAQSLTEGDQYNLLIHATDPDNDTLTFSAASLPVGFVFLADIPSVSWIPGNDQAGTYHVTFSVSDETETVSETVVFTVSNGNEAPVLDAIGDQTISEGNVLEFVVTASDVNGDALSYSASGLPPGATFDIAQQRFSWTPEYTQAGSFTASITVSDSIFNDSETFTITVANSNRPPVISGSPAGSVMATTSYSFTPVASDPDGEALNFTISNKPGWASFDSSTGQLSGIPGDGDVGSFSNIIISASDDSASQSLSPFSIDVVAYVHQDSDGDGILDHLDAFPNDPNEWLDTDGDSIGNNSDSDDDNDGVADIRDGSPLDSTQSGWLITATASAGGYISPAGENRVLYGGAQHYELTPMNGYYINDLLVDNVSVGLTADYDFENIETHHSITAVFTPIPDGLSCNPLLPGLPGVERVDGDNDSSNLVDGKPKLDLDYRFHIVLRDLVNADQRYVFLILDDYKYPMALDSGALSNGADYVYTTRLGPAYSHQFYFTVEDPAGNSIGRYPDDGTLAGPTVELFNGKNVIGLSVRINPYGLNAADVCQSGSQVYRWNPAVGQFELVDSGAPISSSDGYVLKRDGGVLPNFASYGQIAEQTQEFQVKPGWNLISNPYAGNVSLQDVSVRIGDNSPVLWLAAAESNFIVDGIYSYRGSDWGGGNEFSSAAGDDSAILIPWIGYWVYINSTEDDVSLIIPKPLQ